MGHNLFSPASWELQNERYAESDGFGDGQGRDGGRSKLSLACRRWGSWGPRVVNKCLGLSSLQLA